MQLNCSSSETASVTRVADLKQFSVINILSKEVKIFGDFWNYFENISF